MTETIKGTCLCAAIKFEVSGPFESFFLCHCSRCQKATGSAHAANLFSTTAKIRWISGDDKIKTYCVPNTRHKKSFCSECGSPIPSLQMAGKLLVVPAGCLDSDVAIKANAHIHASSRATWDCDLEHVPEFEELP